MKRKLLTLAVLATASTLMAGIRGSTFSFSTAGGTYADGTAVPAGETYVLVHVAGGEFAGVKSDGSPVNGADTVVGAYAAGDNYSVEYLPELYPGGQWVLVLLDTRDASGAPVPGGTVFEYAVTEKLVARSGASSVFGGLSAITATGGFAAENAASATPVITGIDVDGETVKLEVADLAGGSFKVVESDDLANWTAEEGTGSRVSGGAKTITKQVGSDDESEVKFFRIVPYSTQR